MAMPLISASDLVVAENHPRYTTDIKNRAGKYIQAQLEEEHDSDGRHIARSAALKGDVDTFTGNGTSQAITLNDADVKPAYMLVFEVADTSTEFVVNGGFSSGTTSWSVTGGTIASVAGGTSGNCCEVTQGTTNLVTNGSFETDLTGWTVTQGTITGGNAGGYSGNCAKTTMSTNGDAMTQTFTAITGANYSLTFYMKSSSNGFWYQTVSNGNVAVHAPTTDWQQFLCSVSGVNGNIIFLFSDLYGGLTRYFDEVCCYEVPTITQTITTSIGSIYRLTGYVKSGTSGNEYYAIGADGANIATGTSSATWTAFSADFTASGTSTQVYFRKNTNTPGTMLFDSISVIELPKEQTFAIQCGTSQLSWYGRETVTAGTSLSDMAAGTFTATKSDVINNSGETDYYLVLGTDTTSTFTRDAGGTDPDWVEDGEAGQGGAVGTEVANKVENHIETQFLVAHADAGTHTTNPYATTSKIECYNFVGTGSLQTVTLQTAIDISYVEVWTGGGAFVFASDTMTTGKTKQEGTAAFQTGQIGSLGTGSFTFTGTASTIYYYLAIGV